MPASPSPDLTSGLGLQRGQGQGQTAEAARSLCRRGKVKKERRLLQYHRIRPPKPASSTSPSRSTQTLPSSPSCFQIGSSTSELFQVTNKITRSSSPPSLSSARKALATTNTNRPANFLGAVGSWPFVFLITALAISTMLPISEAKSTLMTSSAYTPFRFRVVAKKGLAPTTMLNTLPTTAKRLVGDAGKQVALETLSERLERDERDLARLSASMASSAQQDLLTRPKKKRDYVTLQCRGMYDQGIFAQLNRICDDCYNLYKDLEVHQYCRSDCFSTSTFRQCLQSLLLDKESDFYLELVEIIGKKKKK